MWKFLLISLLLPVICGCTTGTVDDPALQDPAHWLGMARARHLAGESNAEFVRLRSDMTNEIRKQSLSDLLSVIPNMPPEQAAETAADILHECILAASTLLVPANMEPSQYAVSLFAGKLDYNSSLLLAEKARLDAIAWKNADDTLRESEIYAELASRFGAVPGKLRLPEPDAVSPVTRLPDIISSSCGSGPQGMLRFGAVILALPGEFARQIIASARTDIDGIWLETRYLAYLTLLHVAESELAKACTICKYEPTPDNLFRWRKWYYRKKLYLSGLPRQPRSTENQKQLTELIKVLSHF